MPCIEPRYHIKFPQFPKPSGPKPPINLWLIIEYHWVDLCMKTSLIERNLDAFLWWEISDFHPRMTQTHQDFFIHLFVLRILKWTYWKASPKLGKLPSARQADSDFTFGLAKFILCSDGISDARWSHDWEMKHVYTSSAFRHAEQMHVLTSSRKLLVHFSSKFIPTLICPCILSLDETVVCSSRKACFSVQRHHFYRRLGAVGNLTGWAWQRNGMIPHSQKCEPVHVATAFERPTQSWKRLQACSCCVCGGFAEHSHCVLFTLHVSSMTHWLGAASSVHWQLVGKMGTACYPKAFMGGTM